MTAYRLTKPTIAVIGVLLAASEDEPVWGLRVAEEANLFPGTVYPILARLTERGWIVPQREKEQPVEARPGQPHRTYYRFTATGRSEALAALAARRQRRAASRR